MSTIVFIIIALVVMSLGAELLVRSASLLAFSAGISPLFVGLVIVGFGTSSPELGASISATLKGSNDVGVGNVIGSNIFNIAVILAITALVRPISVRIDEISGDLKVAIISSIVPFIAIAFGGVLPRLVGLIMVGGLIAYMVRSFLKGRNLSDAKKVLFEDEVKDTLAIKSLHKRSVKIIWLNIIILLLSFVMLIFGSKIFVEYAVSLARQFEVSELVIGLTIVSAGTSLPELITSLIATKRGNVDLAVGNIIGSNIFNVFGILGLCAIINPQTVSQQTLMIDTPIMLIASVALLPIIKSGGIISRKEAIFLLLGYLVYLTFLLTKA